MLFLNAQGLNEFTVETPDGQPIRVLIRRNGGGKITRLGIDAPDDFPISRPGYKAGKGLTHSPKGTDR